MFHLGSRVMKEGVNGGVALTVDGYILPILTADG